MARIGYARTSTADQNLDGQLATGTVGGYEAIRRKGASNCAWFNPELVVRICHTKRPNVLLSKRRKLLRFSAIFVI